MFGGVSGLRGYIRPYTTTLVTTTPYTVLSSDQMIVVSPVGGLFTVNLPAGVANRTYTIVHGSNSLFDVFVVPNGAETIDGQPGILLTARQSITLVFDGTTWRDQDNLQVPQPFTDAFDGSPNFDGAATVLGIAPVGGIYTLTQNIAAETISVRSGVRIHTAGFAFWCRLLYTEAGSFISFNGNNGVGTAGGALFSNQGHLGCAGGAGGNGASRTTIGSTNGSNGAGAGSGSIGGASGAGGAGGTGAGGTYNSTAALGASQFRFWRSPFFAYNAWKMPPTGNATAYTNVNGGGGGGGGGVQITGQTGALSLDGGGGGGAAGIVAFYAGVLDARGTIEALGGNGGNAVINAGVTGGAGGGGGGAGGGIHASVGRVARLGTFRVPGGSGGTGAGGATGFAGLNGTPGSLALFVNGEAV